MSFTSLGLSDFLLNALSDLGYKEPTPIQLKAIPATLVGKDILATAETGSGKTAGFALPILENLQSAPAAENYQVTALILVPTRELAAQVEEAVRQYGKYFPRQLKTLAIYGGVSIQAQVNSTQDGCDVVVATPGRLIDLLDRGALELGSVKTLVLDEADRMMNLGFAEELNDILDELPEPRQNLLFSATFPDDVRSLVGEILHNPIEVAIQQDTTLPVGLIQRAIEVDRVNRTMLLKHLLTTEHWSQVLIFVSSKRTANNIEMKLFRAGISADTLHGDLTQAERSAALKDFKSGHSKILIATDLAARGLDIPNLPCVINYELPRSTADFIHRIGRTARAGEPGLAISFIDHASDAHFKLIEKRIEQKILREQITNFERSAEVPEEVLAAKGKAPVKGKRKSKKDKLREAAGK